MTISKSQILISANIIFLIQEALELLKDNPNSDAKAWCNKADEWLSD